MHRLPPQAVVLAHRGDRRRVGHGDDQARPRSIGPETQEPLESDAHRTTDAAQRNPLHQQAFDQTPLISGDEVLLAALDKLAPTVVAVMVLFAVMNMPIFLVLGGLAWTHLSDEHGFC